MQSLPSVERAERRTAIAVSVALLVFALAASIFGKSLGPNTAGVLPLIAVVWSLCDLLTALILFAEFFNSGRIMLTVMAAAYAFSGLLSWAYISSYMSITRSSAAGLGQQQVPPTLYLIWHAAFALAVIAASACDRDGVRVPARAIARVAAGMAAAAVVAATGVAALVGKTSGALPVFVADGLFRAPYWGAAVPAVVILTTGAIFALILRYRTLRGLPLWFAVALFTSLLDAVLNLVSPVRSSFAWDAGKIMTAAAASIVMVFLFIDIVRMLAQSNRTIAQRTNRGAARMRALWQIATTDGLSEAAHIQMILETAAANIRSGRDVLGVLGHLDDGAVVIDAIAPQERGNALDAAAAAYAPGSRVPLEADVFGMINQRGRTCAWHGDRELDALLCVSTGLQSVIAAPIYVGNQTSFMFFGLPDPMSDEPFIESDIAFIDVVASNISHRFHQRTQLERLQFQIEHDSLTGLYNRTQFNRFGRIAAMDGSLFGIIAINLDGFRTINEQAGQMIGDELLLEIAASLRTIGEGDVVARLGGDDFAVLLLAGESVETLATRLHAYESIFHRPFHTGDRDGKVFLNVTASIGAAHFGKERLSFDDALVNATVALDHSKEAGGNRGTIFGSDLQYIAQARSLERAEINAAFANDEFVLEYQPTFEMNTRTVVGAEALIRWEHPTRGRMPPGRISRRRQTGQRIRYDDGLVVRRIARDLIATPLPDGIRCYVNVPTLVLDSDSFLVNLQETLEAHPPLAAKLGLEITESDVMDKVERAIDTLKIVRQLGLTVAIDDFGTGYSSLSYLKRLPIDVVKLDKTFIDGLPDDHNDVALATMFSRSPNSSRSSASAKVSKRNSRRVGCVPTAA